MVRYEVRGVSDASVTATRLIAAVLVGAIGICELLAPSPWFDPDLLPDWLATPIAVTGFFAVLFLWSFLGNSIIAVGSLLILWRVWQWPLWTVVPVSIPYWIVTYRLSPKPW